MSEKINYADNGKKLTISLEKDPEDERNEMVTFKGRFNSNEPTYYIVTLIVHCRKIECLNRYCVIKHSFKVGYNEDTLGYHIQSDHAGRSHETELLRLIQSFLVFENEKMSHNIYLDIIEDISSPRARFIKGSDENGIQTLFLYSTDCQGKLFFDRFLYTRLNTEMIEFQIKRFLEIIKDYNPSVDYNPDGEDNKDKIVISPNQNLIKIKIRYLPEPSQHLDTTVREITLTFFRSIIDLPLADFMAIKEGEFLFKYRLSESSDQEESPSKRKITPEEMVFLNSLCKR